jgi:hypothetical protein
VALVAHCQTVSGTIRSIGIRSTMLFFRVRRCLWIEQRSHGRRHIRHCIGENARDLDKSLRVSESKQNREKVRNAPTKTIT